jgi:hypothetical protein
MTDEISPEEHASFLISVIANTGSLDSFVEADRKLLEDCPAAHIETVGELLPRELALALPRPSTIH